MPSYPHAEPSFQALHRIHRTMVRAKLAQQGLDDLGSPTMLLTLHHQFPPDERPSQRQLAELLTVTPATIAMSLKSLERFGYVEKFADPKDQRCKRIGLTPKGIDAVKQCDEIFGEINTKVMDGFSAEEKEQLESYHQRMLTNIHAIACAMAKEEGI